jgi:hypothetical protein
MDGTCVSESPPANYRWKRCDPNHRTPASSTTEKGSHSIRDSARWLDFSPRKFIQTPSLMPLVGLFPHDLPTCLKRAVVGPEGSRPRASLSRDATHLLPIRHAAVMSRGENPTDVRVRHFQ